MLIGLCHSAHCFACLFSFEELFSGLKVNMCRHIKIHTPVKHVIDSSA